MTLYQLFLILRARAWVVFTCLLLGILAAMAINLLMPKQYTASATVVVDPKVVDTVTGQLLPPPLMSTQLEIIKSHRVALDVVNATRLAESQVARQMFEEKTQGRGSIRDWWADRLLLSTEVQSRQQSNLVDIKFTAQEPRFAALAANAFAKAYQEVTLQLAVEPARQTSSFFDDQLKALRQNLEAAQTRLSQYQRESGIVASDDKLDVEYARLDELYNQLALVQADARDSGTRERNAADYAKRGRSPEEIPEVLANPLIQSLKGELLRAESKLKESSAIIGANHPQFLRQKAEVDSLRQKLNQEIKYAVASMGTTSAIHKEREAQLVKAVEDQKAKMLQLKQQHNDIAVLRGEVDSAQKAYDSAMQRFSYTTLASRTTQTNVMMLNPAVEPIEPSAPNVMRNLLVGLIAGIVLGLNIAFVVEVFDRRVRSEDDLGAELALPVIGVLERRSDRRRWSERFLPARPGSHRLLEGARSG